MNEQRCPLCPIYEVDEHEIHNNTVIHRFNYNVLVYNKNRRSLVSNRHGIEFSAEPQLVNNLQLHFRNWERRGKYTIKVTPEQLRLHHTELTFDMTIKNIKSEDIHISALNILHPSHCFELIYDRNYDFGILDPNAIMLLKPKESYTFQVKFTPNVTTNGSYKIPIACDLQTTHEDPTMIKCFTLARTLLVFVKNDDQDSEDEETKKKSPFTRQPWRGITRCVPMNTPMPYGDLYPIPKNMIKILKYKFKAFPNMTDEERRVLNELILILEELKEENYAKYWHTVLWLQETSEMLSLTKYHMENVTMELNHRDVLILEVPGLAEKRPSVITGDYINIRIHDDHTVYKGLVILSDASETSIEIHEVNDELISFIGENPTLEMDVEFQLGRLPFERMHKGVDMVVANGMVSLFFDNHFSSSGRNIVHNLQNRDYINQSIISNAEQKNAITNILNSVQHLPYIVFGPPGTGKTITIVEAILQIKKNTNKRIVVCAPSNSACDVLASKMLRYCSTSELIRIHSNNREKSTIDEKLKEFSNIDEEDNVYRVDIDTLRSYRIVVTTLVLIGRYGKDYRPDCVFIDEAAQANEPEADIVIGLLSLGKQVVLSGDPMQLGPIAAQCSAEYGLGISLIERLMKYPQYSPQPDGEYNSQLITMLKLNFRSHRDILQIPNQLFYETRLIAQSVEAHRDPIVDIAIFPTTNMQKHKSAKQRPGRAIEFCSISAKERKEGASPSFFNTSEVMMVLEYVKALIRLDLESNFKVTADQIGVVTPYKRQMSRIRRKLFFSGFKEVEVGTTEFFQGREKRIIIISTVRAQHALLLQDLKYNLGFVKQPQRFNVALTRAQSKLIVIGCPVVLVTDEKWEMYINLCKALYTFYGDNYIPRDANFQRQVVEKMRRFRERDDQHAH